MEANSNQNGQETPKPPPQQPRFSEKVIQPLSPNLTAPQVAPRPVQTNLPSNNTVPAYDPTTYNPFRRAESPPPLPSDFDEETSKTVAVLHKSLMVLAIVGLLATVFAIFGAVQINHAIEHARQTSTADLGSARVSLDIVYASIFFNILVNVYFLLAKNRHTVATVLKVLLALEIINVFGVFWGLSSQKGITLLLDGAYLLFAYIVLNIIRTADN